ncbi:MAG TPA: WcbI family polysaccharide biosynthesis putative acetyltransferase [Methylocystis sp.]|nr:WcbI family polysaccharide biosynthesis putative acetyltransferase [Methylocystis sp.]
MLSQIDKQIIRASVGPHLARLKRQPPAAGPRIAVIGNCQSYGVAYAMKLLDPLAQVDHYSAITPTIASIDRLAAVLSKYDRVFSQDFPPGVVKGGDSQELLRRLSNAQLFPTLNFAGFQPDLVYLTDATRANRVLNGPLRPYHSALAVFAYRVGLKPDAAQALFNRNVYEAVGYLNVWEPAAAEFLENARRYDMDLSAELMSWSRRGVFMYSIVHPKPFVLADIARQLLAAAGLKIRNDNSDAYAIDDLARAEIFPVYPEIAELYGVRGGYLFKCGNFHISAGVGEFLTLPQFLSGCYAVYKKARPEQIAHPRIDAWLADAELTGRLVRLANENLARGLTPVL